MLNKVRELAMEKFAGDMSLVNEFMTGFAKQAMNKQAGPNDDFQSNQIVGTVMKGVSKAFGEGIGGLMISGSIGAMGHAAGNIRKANLRTRFLESLEQVIKHNPIVNDEASKGARELNMVKGYAETIFKFGPNIAADVNLLSTLLANAVHGSAIDPMTIKTITDLEGKYSDNNTFTPKAYV